MKALASAIQQMIDISQEEMDEFFAGCFSKHFGRRQVVAHPHTIPSEVFFIEKGILRVLLHDQQGTEHTIHFALEHQFICDYSAFMQKEVSIYTLETLEPTEVVVLPRSTIDWGYQHLKEGEKMGRLIAEFYFIYQDNRIKNQYIRTAKERYDMITKVFPNIHNRAPQHMIASYLGITPIHLSRLKKADLDKV